jgi:LL-diaminopimelate aminotransferase
MTSFLEAVSRWYKSRFGVSLHPTKECVTLIGSKEGIAHIHLALINPGDVVLVPNPGYPVYETGTLFAGGEVVFTPLLEKNNYLPDLNTLSDDVLKRAKILWVNYPHNPTGAVATREFYEELVTFAKKNDILICSDAAYTELYFGKKPLSFLEIDGAKEVGLEFHSLSKTYNMTGWRIGMACGNPDAIAALGKIKTNIDSGQFQAVQEAGIAALDGDESHLDQLRATYEERRQAFCDGLDKAGLSYKPLEATFYIWVKVPEGFKSAEFSKKLLTEAGIVGTPGTGFGKHGKGYIRFTLCKTKQRLQEAGKRIAQLMQK